MGQVLAVFRLAGALVVLLVGAPLVLLGTLLPVKVQGNSVPIMVGAMMARLFCVLFNVRIECPKAHRIRTHVGLIFPNHLSYLDSIILLVSGPVRFLSAAEVRRYPVVGWIARSMDTVFVARSDPNSRQRARSAVVDAFEAQSRPPIVIYPEGRLGIGTALFAFRHGAFEIAVKNGIPYMPCAIRHEPAHIALWRGIEGEKLLPALWRLAQFPGPVVSTLTPIQVVVPSVDDNPAALAAAAQAEICRELAVPTVISASAENLSDEAMPAPAWKQSMAT